MTHYDISYSDIKTDVERDAKAIADIREYLGDAKFAQIVSHAVVTPIYQMDFALSFAGVRGFPVFAFMRKYYSKEVYDAWYATLD